MSADNHIKLMKRLHARFQEIGLGDKEDRSAFLTEFTHGAKSSTKDLTTQEIEGVLALLDKTHPPKAIRKMVDDQKALRRLRSALIARAQDATILPRLPYGTPFSTDNWRAFNEWLQRYTRTKKTFGQLTAAELREVLKQVEAIISREAPKPYRRGGAKPAQDTTPNPSDPK